MFYDQEEKDRSRAGRIILHLGGLTLLMMEFFRCLFSRRFGWRLFIQQLDHLGVKSISIVNLTAIFTGMVLALQTHFTLGRLGVKYFIGEVVSISLVRELGPVLTALMVGGRVGAGITAEIGSMKVTEQVDAMRALGASPVRRMVIPKVLATMIMLPLLTVLADFLGIMGGMVIAVTEMNLTARYYLESVLDALQLEDVFSGVGKAMFFGHFIALIGCYNGLRVVGGADGVGRQTTNTVVAASIVILASNFFLTKLFILL